MPKDWNPQGVLPMGDFDAWHQADAGLTRRVQNAYTVQARSGLVAALGFTEK